MVDWGKERGEEKMMEGEEKEKGGREGRQNKLTVEGIRKEKKLEGEEKEKENWKGTQNKLFRE